MTQKNKKFISLGIIILVLFCIAVDQAHWGGVKNKEELIESAHFICEGSVGDAPPKEFTSDACSLWPNASWSTCCVSHDYKYWCGGDRDARRDADEELLSCVNNVVPYIGSVMYIGVRLGGLDIWPVPWRWGYGYIWPKYQSGD